MKIFIKNMVCNRCIMAVEQLFKSEGLEINDINLGMVDTIEQLTNEQLNSIDAKLSDIGFELIDDKKSQIIDKIKTTVIELVHHTDGQLKTNLSDYLAEKLNYDYHYLSNIYSEVEGTTIEKFYIAQRIEKVKELLVYDELTLSEIAFKLHYSSVAHLSSQFKKVTGLTPSYFKNIRTEKRKPLDKV
ncbi:helix-turn-helix domain-containing protein [Fulvivirga lutimaris]|uniref:helix-turn-helix domain-containing protein n=1 Tax=Fulvivirga lutimaris TaxID=1819566 RepID=UPI0012BB6CA4|nr:AraC family transcriptional regulator [Fulvivirga lutimaris]MTI39754.1 AraC family transcriptional regulator [Fulvivirga lutimaris]